MAVMAVMAVMMSFSVYFFGVIVIVIVTVTVFIIVAVVVGIKVQDIHSSRRYAVRDWI
jgi:uncharacterized membrane protein